MRLGQKAMEALQAEVTGCLQPGDELVVACPVALGGTSRIAKQEREKLSDFQQALSVTVCCCSRNTDSVKKTMKAEI